MPGVETLDAGGGKPMRVVLDTNILVAATFSPFGASFQILTLVPQRRFTLLLSVALLLEYEEVLKRDDMRARSHLTLEEVDALLNMLAAVGTPCTPVFQWRPQLLDPDDEMVLELAVNGRAEAIVTVNTRDFLPAARIFGVEVLRPGEFLRRLRS
jgi:putative PIN family toxin of toxin-antitoxin system